MSLSLNDVTREWRSVNELYYLNNIFINCVRLDDYFYFQVEE